MPPWLRFAVVSVLVAVPASGAIGQAPPLPFSWAAQQAGMKAAIGRTFWIAKPFNKGLELCPSSVDRFDQCARVFDTSVTIESANPGKSHGKLQVMPMYGVKLADGRRGFMLATDRDRFLDAEPSAAERAQIAQCEQSGPPIGMPKRLALACWGAPSATNTTTTAAGKTEQMVYRTKGFVYIENDRVVAVQTQQ